MIAGGPLLGCDRKANFAVSPIPNISFGFQLSGADQNCQPRVKFVGRDSYSALFERLLGLSDNSCDLQPTHVATVVVVAVADASEVVAFAAAPADAVAQVAGLEGAAAVAAQDAASAGGESTA
jgi:hypothetical protein